MLSLVSGNEVVCMRLCGQTSRHAVEDRDKAVAPCIRVEVLNDLGHALHQHLCHHLKE